MTDRLKSGTEAWNLRQDRHRYNGFIGSAAMMRSQCNSIINSKTATAEAKRLADDIFTLAERLTEALKTRRPGT